VRSHLVLAHVVGIEALQPVLEAFGLLGRWCGQRLGVGQDVRGDVGGGSGRERRGERVLADGRVGGLFDRREADLVTVEEGDDAEVRSLFDTNFFGAVDMIKAVLPGMRAQGSGHIVNVSSMTGIVTNPPNTYYSCTKHALEALTEGLAKEVGPLGIKVCAVEPGAFQTDYVSRSMHQADSLDDYAHVTERKELIQAFAEHLPGDPAKLAAAVLQLVGLDDPPLRLLLGRDVLNAYREKTAEWSATVDEWEPVTTSVNFNP